MVIGLTNMHTIDDDNCWWLTKVSFQSLIKLIEKKRFLRFEWARDAMDICCEFEFALQSAICFADDDDETRSNSARHPQSEITLSRFPSFATSSYKNFFARIGNAPKIALLLFLLHTWSHIYFLEGCNNSRTRKRGNTTRNSIIKIF